MWVGNVTADDNGSSSNFNLEVDGERLEISEQRDDDGNVVNSRSFRFDAETGDMLGGTEVSAGKIVEYGANHTKLSESLSLTLGENETIAITWLLKKTLRACPRRYRAQQQPTLSPRITIWVLKPPISQLMMMVITRF